MRRGNGPASGRGESCYGKFAIFGIHVCALKGIVWMGSSYGDLVDLP